MSKTGLRVAVSALLLLLILAPPVAAHSQLETADPGPDDVVTRVPSELVANFTQDLDHDRSSMELRDATGATLARGEKDPDEARVMRMSLPSLANGVYTVRWTTFSTEDGELARGTYEFTVRLATPAPTATPEPTPAPTPPPTAAPTRSPSPSPSALASPSLAPSASIAPPSPSPSVTVATPTIASPSVPSASPASPDPTPATDSTQVLIPIVVALAVAAILGVALVRRRTG